MSTWGSFLKSLIVLKKQSHWGKIQDKDFSDPRWMTKKYHLKVKWQWNSGLAAFCWKSKYISFYLCSQIFPKFIWNLKSVSPPNPKSWGSVTSGSGSVMLGCPALGCPLPIEGSLSHPNPNFCPGTVYFKVWSSCFENEVDIMWISAFTKVLLPEP